MTTAAISFSFIPRSLCFSAQPASEKIFAPFWDLNLDAPAWAGGQPDEAGKRISRKHAEAQEPERQNTVLGNLCALALFASL